MNSSSPVDADLNGIIATAVQAKITAQVAQALASDETMSAFVVAALQQPMEVGSYSDKRKTTFIAETCRNAVQAQTQAVVAEVVAEQADRIKDEVRKALRKSIGVIADGLVDGFVANASGRYPSIKVEFANDSL